jgi:hypothetical protein
METSSSESSGLTLVHELTLLSTNVNGKRSPPCSLYEESKRRRLLEEDDMETSSRDSRWSQYRDCTNLSTLTEQSDPPEPTNVLEGCNLHVAAHQVSDLEEHIEKLAMELEEWSLVNLKEWRQQQFGDKMHETRQGRSREAVKKQMAAKRKLMRALRHHDTGYEAMEE